MGGGRKKAFVGEGWSGRAGKRCVTGRSRGRRDAGSMQSLPVLHGALGCYFPYSRGGDESSHFPSSCQQSFQCCGSADAVGCIGLGYPAALGSKDSNP